MALAKRSLFLFVFSVFLLSPFAAQARGHHHSYDDTAISVVLLSGLPVEVRDTFHLIKQGGPFPYPRDGIVFGNREHQLPPQVRGYYHEYTVKTPGVQHRGARRIVCGAVPECYYTGDHYQTFQRIRE